MFDKLYKAALVLGLWGIAAGLFFNAMRPASAAPDAQRVVIAGVEIDAAAYAQAQRAYRNISNHTTGPLYFLPTQEVK